MSFLLINLFSFLTYWSESCCFIVQIHQIKDFSYFFFTLHWHLISTFNVYCRCKWLFSCDTIYVEHLSDQALRGLLRSPALSWWISVRRSMVPFVTDGQPLIGFWQNVLTSAYQPFPLISCREGRLRRSWGTRCLPAFWTRPYLWLVLVENKLMDRRQE